MSELIGFADRAPRGKAGPRGACDGWGPRKSHASSSPKNVLAPGRKKQPPAPAFVAKLDLAGDRLDKNHENKRVCTGNLKAEHISEADWQAEMDKCAPDPTAY